jgi:hypothetical protein
MTSSNNDLSLKGKSIVSFSQYKMFYECPKHYKLVYIDKIGKYDDSLELDFGDSIHKTLQEYLHTYYEKTINEADNLNLRGIFFNYFLERYEKNSKKDAGHYGTKEQLLEYCKDGEAIIDYFKKHKTTFFSKKNVKLLGTELNIIDTVIESKQNVLMKLLLDVVLHDEKNDELIIYDFKTSRQGWRDNKKKDKMITDQLILYKKFYSLKYNFPIEKIKIAYIILKRKLFEHSEFPQKRIVAFAPAAGSVSVNKAMKRLNEFVEYVFDENGQRIADKEYPAHSGEKDSNCTYCPFKRDYANCDRKARIKESYLK